MRTFSTKRNDQEALPAREAATAARPDLNLDMLYEFLRQIAQTLDADAQPWRKQLAVTPRGADFDLRDMNDGTSVLDKLAMTGDAVGEALDRGDVVAEVGEGVLPHLAAPFEALGRHREAARTDARQQMFVREHGATLSRLEDDISNVSRSMGELSRIAARGAASLDPDATRRILARMRDLGDASIRLIEARIASTGTRDEGKRLRALRDDLKVWVDNRNARLEQLQMAVDDLNIRSNALRNECLMQAKRLVAAATLAGKTSAGSGRMASHGSAEQTSPEAMVLAAGLRALLLQGRSDITAPLRE